MDRYKNRICRVQRRMSRYLYNKSTINIDLNRIDTEKIISKIKYGLYISIGFPNLTYFNRFKKCHLTMKFIIGPIEYNVFQKYHVFNT